MSPTPDQIALLLAHTAPFSYLPEADRAQALEALLISYHDADEVVLAQGVEPLGHLYLVVSGHVQLRDARSQQLFDELSAGDVFGGGVLLGEGAVPFEARAQAPTVCALLPASSFHALAASTPRFGAFFRQDVQPVGGAVTEGREAALFQTALRHLVHRPPVQCTPGTTARAAAAQMKATRVSSVLVVDDGQACGLLTRTDLVDRLLVEGRPPETPVEVLMSQPVVSLPADAPAFRGLMTLMQHRLHHLVLTETPDPASTVVGVLSGSDLLRLQGYDPVHLLKEIEQAASVDALVHVRPTLNRHLARLHRQGLGVEELVAFNTEVNDRLTSRVLHLTEAAVRAEDPTAVPPLRWAWIALGSEGRQEMSLKTDQDNALLYEDPADEAQAAQARAWFLRLAQAANEALDRCGFTLCPGEVMARNPTWCQPLAAWVRTFRTWILEPDPKALMHASIFFDLRGLYGDEALVEALQDGLRAALARERGFLPFLMHNAQANRPPLSFFRRFVLDRTGEHRNTFDVKLRGLMPIVDVARVLALEAGFLASTNTLDRLRHVAETQPTLTSTAQDAAEAYRYLIDLRLNHHFEALQRGADLDNHIDPSTLTKVQQQTLKAVFTVISDLQEVLAHRYGADLMR
ncbi:MAG: DUF294 nucleotidyltransferase-like domain-containing protein [Bacteroidota bacterium]